ncbi:beta-galactosidase [Chitinophaga pollutisoli]|uniref:Beta-galactosidase n=1 Tax=Chitinophaga pollutisoli TaxID=3133966 RepID=A0ABZ2YRU4_9BACT
MESKSAFLILSMAGLLYCSGANAQAREYTVDASASAEATGLPLSMKGTSPEGVRLEVNSKYFVKNGQPWFPVMGELHYNRVPAGEWATEIRKMKSAGISVIATYIFWNEHEIKQNHWDWSNNRDLRRFVETCKQNGMYVWLRIGPWCHGEQLHGGFPDWIEHMKGHRRNTPAYLDASAELFRQIGRQTQGLYFETGGPVIGVQLENEYASGEKSHIAELKKRAVQAGIKPVYWTVTANTVFDDAITDVIPLQGAYPYRGWEAGGGGPTKDFLYGNDQWIMTGAFGKVYYDISKYPRGLCEQGCGSQQTYQNRFIVEPHVVEAHLQNQVGRGMNLVGYYMFHGGTQTPGLAEPGYPASYDFQAPVSEFGLLRPSYHHLKVIHHFINDFGSDLATMRVVPAPHPVTNEKDTSELRFVARARGNSGFLFLCNTQVRVPMPAKNVSIKVKLDHETITFPEMKIAEETAPILPFNLTEQGLTIKYVTAQPLARITRDRHTTLFFFRLPGVLPEFGLDAKGVTKVNAGGWKQISAQTISRYSGGENPVEIQGMDGARVTLVFLSREEAEQSWRMTLKGKDVLILTKADVVMNDQGLELRQAGNHHFQLRVFPSDAISGKKTGPGKLFTLHSRKVKAASTIAVPLQSGSREATVPLPSGQTASIADWIMAVSYQGGKCELLRDGQLLTDDLYNGSGPWLITLRRFRDVQAPLQLAVHAWNKDITGVPEKLAQKIAAEGPRINGISLIPQYKTIIR